MNPIRVIWGNRDRTLIYMIFGGEWDWRDFYRAAGQVANLMVTVPHTVNIILDLRRCKHAPPDFPVHAARPSFHRRNVGRVIAVQREPSIFRFLSEVAWAGQPPVYGNVVYARSLSQAHTLLDNPPA